MAANIFKCYREFIGYAKDSYPLTTETYAPVHTKEVAEQYLKYLNDLNVTHFNRQDAVENKNALLIGQSSVVISIVALFVPILVSSISEFKIWVVILIFLALIFLIFHFTLSIIHAIKTLEADKNKYMSGATSTITKATRVTEELDFLNVQIKDLVDIVNYNKRSTNRTASNLVYASRCFKIAIVGFAMFSVLMLFLLSIAETGAKNRDFINRAQTNNAPENLKYDTVRQELDSLKLIITTISVEQQKAKITADTASPHK